MSERTDFESSSHIIVRLGFQLGELDPLWTLLEFSEFFLLFLQISCLDLFEKSLTS